MEELFSVADITDERDKVQWQRQKKSGFPPARE
jgi:hypothetical protein